MAERVDRPAGAEQAGFAGVTRKVLERLALPGDNRELVVVEVTYPPGGVAPYPIVPPGPTPAAPATGMKGLYHQNPNTAITLIFCVIYLVLGITTKVVFLGIAPIFMTVRAFQRKEQYAAVAAAAAALAIVLALVHI